MNSWIDKIIFPIKSYQNYLYIEELRSKNCFLNNPNEEPKPNENEIFMLTVMLKFTNLKTMNL